MSKKHKKKHRNKKKHKNHVVSPTSEAISQPATDAVADETKLNEVTPTEQQTVDMQKKSKGIPLPFLYVLLCIGITVIIVLSAILFCKESFFPTDKNKDVSVFLPVVSDTADARTTASPAPSENAPETYTDTPADTLPPAETVDPSENKKENILDVKNILQKPGLPNGCEVTSLSIALNYLGYDIDPITLYYDFMPSSDYQDGDPWTTYVGDATDRGYGCFAPCVVKTGNDYIRSVGGDHLVRDVSYKRITEYEKYIDQGIPVIMWGMIGMEWNPKLAWVDYIDGEEVLWYSYSHCMVLIGYTEDEYVFCDPLEGIVYYNKYNVLDCFTALFKQACIIDKYDPAMDESYTEEIFDETVETEEEIPEEIPDDETEETLDETTEEIPDEIFPETSNLSPEDML